MNVARFLNRKKDWGPESVGGVTTFFTMSYIVVVNPTILSSGTGMPFDGVLAATVLLCFTMTLFMGLYANLPFAVAPGMGINAFFTYTLILGRGIPWPTALGMVFWSGVLFLLLSLTSLRESVARAIPRTLQIAAAAGIGMFLCFIGLKNCGLVVASPATLVTTGAWTEKTIVSVVGVLAIAWMLRRRSAFAFLSVIAAITVYGFFRGWTQAPSAWFSTPDFSSVFLKMDPIAALRVAFIPAIVSLMLTDFLDSISTFVGVSRATGLVDPHGEPREMRKGLLVDAFATLGGGVFGTSAGTAYIESSAGIEAGGRTGVSAVVTALCFLPCFFLAPWVAMVPEIATAPVLIVVGALMFRSVTELQIQKLEDSVPAFLTAVLIPLTFSITQGILWGFVTHVLLYTISGRAKEIRPMMWGLAGLAVLMLGIEGR